MADPKDQAATQLANLEASTGRSVSDFVEEVRAAGIDKHGAMVAHFKATHGLGHGNANLLAHVVRERLAGGPPSEESLLDAQYAKGKAALRPLYEELAALALALGDDVERVVQKTGVSFRRRKQFALVRAPSAKRVELGLNLATDPGDPRVEATSGMSSHRVVLLDVGEIDDAVAGWLRAAYDEAG